MYRCKMQINKSMLINFFKNNDMLLFIYKRPLSITNLFIYNFMDLADKRWFYK